MIHTILSLFLLTPGALAQMDAVKTNISFTDNNDRFDILAMMRAHDNMYRDTPLVDDDEGVASDVDNTRQLQNDAFLDILQQKRPDTRRADEVEFAYGPDNLPQIGLAGNDDMLDLEFQENLKLFAKPGRRNAPDDDHEGEILVQNFEHKPQGKHSFHTFRRVDDSGFGVDDRFNSFEGGTMSEFEDNLKKFYTEPSGGRTLKDVEGITESGILLQNAPTLMNVDGYSKQPLD